MAFSLPRGLTPPEIAFLCEMEMVTVIPRQRLEGLELLGVSVDPLVLSSTYFGLGNRIGEQVLFTLY